MNLAEQISGLLARRERCAAELADLDRELDEIRAAIGVPSLVRDESVLAEAVIGYLRTNGPTPLGRLLEQTGKSLHKLHAVLKKLGDRVELTGQTNRRIVRLATDATPVPVHVLPEKPPRVLASRRDECTCERCGKVFTPTGGTSGRFCSRDCYEHTLKPAAAPAPAPAKKIATLPEAEPLRVHDVVRTEQAERRCSRCLNRFRPKKADDYVCEKCVGKKSRYTPEPKPEVESVWDGREGLTGDGLGSSIAPARLIGH